MWQGADSLPQAYRATVLLLPGSTNPARTSSSKVHQKGYKRPDLTTTAWNCNLNSPTVGEGGVYGQLSDVWGFEIFVGKEMCKYKRWLALIRTFEEKTRMSPTCVGDSNDSDTD